MQKYMRIFLCFSWGIVFVCVRLLGLRGQAGGRDGGRERGGFFLGKHFFPHILLTDAVPFPLDFPQENVRYLGFPRETTVFLTFWTDFVPFPTFSDENPRYLGCCCLETNRHYLYGCGCCCCCYCYCSSYYSSCGCC